MPDPLDLSSPLPAPAASSAPVAAPAPGQLAAPAGGLVLDPPAAVAPVQDDRAGSMVPLDPAVAAALRTRAEGFAAELAAMNPHSPEFTAKLADIARMGETEVRASSSVSNRMLERPQSSLAAAQNRGEAGGAQAKVARTLMDLRVQITELDPGRADLRGAKKVLGIIPRGNRFVAYFNRYQSAQTQLDAIIKALGSGQDELRRDNASIEQEKVNLWALMGKLTEYATLAAALDDAVEAKIGQLEAAGSADAANTLRADGLFPIRQRRTDITTQLAVAIQGYLALDLVRKNNIELIKGVERAQTTTVAALRTAVIVAQALANQKLVLEQINALNTTTNAMILGTSELLRQQTADVYTQAASATVSVDTLQKAFDNVFATMDAIDGYRVQAAASLGTTVAALETQVGRSQSYLRRVHDADDAARP